MIRYNITKAELEKKIRKVSKTWFTKARERTATFKKLKKYKEPPSSIWGEIKTVFMKAQRYKCAFCEWPLGGARRGKITYDVEHFRPKNKVKEWPPTMIKGKKGLKYSFSTGGDYPGGYYLLAYNILNYTVACKICNTPLKSNYFPIAGNRGDPTEDLESLNQTEKPLLIYPLGTIDTDPEKLITFIGIRAVPIAKRGHNYKRARVTIDFFELNEREELWYGRFSVIRELWRALKDVHTGNDTYIVADSRERIKWYLSPGSPHTNCARVFYKAFRDDPALAASTYKAAKKYMREKGMWPDSGRK